MGRHRKGFGPVPPPGDVALLGPLTYCSRCCEWWPSDEEFYYLNAHGKPVTPCKACRTEMQQAYRRQESA